jgi:sugar (pentulose or hexulose) kinase
MTGERILAIDCGTQSLRALIFDARGALVARRKVEYEPYFSAKPGYAEQDPELWWLALGQAVRGLLADDARAFDGLAAVALTTQRDSMVCVDERGDPLRPAILWLDSRKAPRPYRPGLLTALGLKLIGMDEALARTQESGKCSWLRLYDAEAWKRTRSYMQVSGFLTARLTGEFADSVASQIGHIPFDYKRQRWAASSHRNAKMFPVEPEKLPRLVEPGGELGRISQAACAATGIPAGLPLMAAGSDKGCETLGMGVVDETMASLSFGTTATIQTMSGRYREPQRFMPSFPAVIPGCFNPEVEIFRGYWMITWFKNQFAHEEVERAKAAGMAPEEMLDELLARTPAGGQGLIMQPYWTAGLKTPAARGAVIGFGDAHERAHLYRAIIEGLAFGLKEGLEKIERASGTKVTLLAASGGASQSDRICQISADLFNLPLVRGATCETSGLGAAMCAAAGLGWYPGVRDAALAMSARAADSQGGAGERGAGKRPSDGGLVAEGRSGGRPSDERPSDERPSDGRSRRFEPEPAKARLYAELYERVYKKIYKALAPLYEELRDITGYPEKPAGR